MRIIIAFSLFIGAPRLHAQILRDTMQLSQTYTGYIMRIFEKCDNCRWYSADFIFSRNLPRFEKRKDFNKILTDTNYFLVNEHYYNYAAFVEDRDTSDNPYYLGKPFDSIDLKKYKVKIFRVAVSGYVKYDSLTKYTCCNGTSHSGSVYGMVPLGNDTKARILYPKYITNR